MKFTLRFKLIFLTTFVVTMTMAIVTYFFTIKELGSRQEAVENQMRRIARNIATIQLVDRQNWTDYQNYISRLMAFNDDVVYIAIYDDRNWLRAYTLEPSFIEIDDERMLTGREQKGIVRRLDQGLVAEESRKDLRTERVNIQSGNRVLGSVHVGFSLIDINDELQRKIGRNIGVAIVFIALFSGISILLSRKLSQPLERLSEAMARIASGDIERKVEVESQDEIGELARRFNELVEGLSERRVIEDLGREISGSFRTEQLADLICHRLRKALDASAAALYIKASADDDLFQVSGTTDGFPADAEEAVSLGETARQELLLSSDGVTLAKAPASLRQAFDFSGDPNQTLLVPLRIKSSLFGFLRFHMSDLKVTEHQARFAATLANQSALALENTLLYEKLREQERIRRELEIAREVQLRLLPERMPRLAGFEIAGLCRPAREIGGDYYDFFEIDERRLGVVVADVSGKGTSAAFYMAEIKGMMTTLAHKYQSPQQVLIELNYRLQPSLERQIFATMIYGVLDVDSYEFTFVRAGHDPPLKVAADGGAEHVMSHGIGIGLDRGLAFNDALEETTISVGPGCTLMLYTDGVTEAMNSARELFGEERLLELARTCAGGSSVGLHDSLLAQLDVFCAGAEQHDDLTFLVIKNACVVSSPDSGISATGSRRATVRKLAGRTK